MSSKLKTYLKYGTSYSGIEISSRLGEESFVGVKSKRKENEFIDLDFFHSKSLSDVSTSLGKNQHCHLIINTEKVLIKEIPFTKNISSAISTAFPGLTTSDFYYQVLQTKFKTYMAVARRDYVDGLLKEVEENNIYVIGFQLGFFSASKLISIISEPKLVTSRHILKTDLTEILGFEDHNQEEDVPYEIEDTDVTSRELIALSGLFNYIATAGNISNFSKENRVLENLHQQKIFFRKGYQFAIGFLLISLLINFFVFNSYYKKYQLTQQHLRISEARYSSYDQRLSALENKEKIIESFLISGRSKSSFYINRLIATLPSTLQLNSLEYQPLQQAIRSDKAIHYRKGEIKVFGASNDKINFSFWIEKIEANTWLKRVEVSNYGETTNDISSFELLITINQNEPEN